MCGIVGIIGRKQGGLWGRDLDLMEHALVINTMRGRDSVGCFTAFRNKQAQAIKHGSNPFELFKTKEWEVFRNAALQRGRFVIGHNRAATRGEVNTDNAHPFVEENIILVHNGTLWDTKGITDKEVKVDSNAIAHALVSSTPEEVFPKVNGAFACVWFNTTTQKLYAIRNKDRPLFILENTDNYFLSSEPFIMAMPATRQDRKIDNMIDIEPGTLYEWDMEGKMSSKKLISERKEVVTAPQYGRTTLDTVTDTIEDDAEDVPFFPTREAQPETPTRRDQLRQSLVIKATQITTPHLRSCALTSANDGKTLTSTTESAWTSKLTDQSADKSWTSAVERQRNGQSPTSAHGTGGHTLESPKPNNLELDAYCMAKNRVDNEYYTRGRRVLFRINRTTAGFRGGVKFHAMLMEPGMEMVPVAGFVPSGEDIGPSTLCTGVIYFTQISVHGPEVFVTNVEAEAFTRLHTGEISKHLWKIAFRECVCDECDGAIKLHDKGFTHVSSKALFNKTKSGNPLNVMSVICADCIEKKIPNGDYLETFKAKRRNLSEAIANAHAKKAEAARGIAPVHLGERGCSESSIGPVGTLILPGPATIQ